MNICHLNADVTSVILNYLKCEDAFNLRLTSKYMKECVTNQQWNFYNDPIPSNLIQFPNAIGLNAEWWIHPSISKKTKLQKIKNFNMFLLNEDNLHHLKDITDLDVMLSSQNIEKDTFVCFSKLHTLNIPYISSISDDTFINLKNLHTLNISKCKQITENSFEHLKNIQTLNISDCIQLTDTIFTYMKNIHTLNISGCVRITDNAFIHLKNIHTLSMSSCSQITDNAFIHFTNIYTLDMSSCFRITNNALKHLKNIHTLNISHCNITDNGLEYIKNIHTLTMCYDFGITDKGIDYLQNIHTMNMNINIRDFPNFIKIASNIVNGKNILQFGHLKNLSFIPNLYISI